jgi:hypothetical protein
MNDQLTPAAELFGKPYKRRFKTVELPISGARVRIRSLTERELSAHQASTYVPQGGDLKVSRARLEDGTRRYLALCLVDGDGNRLVTSADAGKFADWDSADTSYLYNECAAHTRTKPEDLEALVKNSEPTPAD